MSDPVYVTLAPGDFLCIMVRRQLASDLHPKSEQHSYYGFVRVTSVDARGQATGYRDSKGEIRGMRGIDGSLGIPVRLVSETLLTAALAERNGQPFTTLEDATSFARRYLRAVITK